MCKKKLYHPRSDLRCLSCGLRFPTNTTGSSDSGVPRPECPRCSEEINVVEFGGPLDTQESDDIDDGRSALDGSYGDNFEENEE